MSQTREELEFVFLFILLLFTWLTALFPVVYR